MNNLSLFMYFAGVVEGLSILLDMTILLLGVTAALTLVFCFVEIKKIPSFFKWLVITTFILAFIVILIPSKQTLYLIAASEIGETTLNTPEAQEILSDLRKILKSYISEEN